MNGPGGTQEEPVVLEGFGPRDLYQRREKIFTRFVGGFFQRLRFFTGWPLLGAYFLLPWLSWDGRQMVLFDLPARQFHIFTTTFYPQDLWMLGWLLIIAAFGLFTITTLVGRLWCGYTCPQTVWTSIFMWSEQLAEGPRHKRIRLDQAPWSLEKLRKRAVKHSMWLGWAALTGITLVGYFAPIRELVVDLANFEASGWATFWCCFFTTTTYLNAGWMREQVCIYMCPYARFQSAMFDKDTLIVSYNPERGEPRGSRKRTSNSSKKSSSQTALREAVPDTVSLVAGVSEAKPALGDCIDCQLCVQVCPVGIDIRDGLQYQCIGCAHCIDACDQVMDKMGYEPGLVSYTTEHELQHGKTHWLRPRSIGYAAVMLVMMGAFSLALINRAPFEVDVLRERGELYQVTANGTISNQYRLRVLNKAQNDLTFQLAIAADMPLSISVDSQLRVEPGELLDLPLTLSAPRESVAGVSTTVEVKLCELGPGASASPDGKCKVQTTTFIGPMP
jgi:cytochrome c oxidase accessory protein FixG